MVEIGVVGTSYWVADFHLPILRSHPGARVRALCGRDRRRARALADRHGVPEVHTDYRAMIDNGGLDALVVVTPEDLHHPMVLAGVQAGLHVLCEKPMAFTADQSAEMLAAAERAGVKHMVQFTSRGLPHYRWIKHLLEDGYVGVPYHAYLTWPTGWFPAQQPNPYVWWADARRAKGAVNELGSHLIDLARWFLGDVVRVSSSVRTFAPRVGPDGQPMDTANDSAMLLLDFVGDAHALLHVGLPNIAGTGLRYTKQTVVISGSDGTLESRWDGSTPPVSEIVGIRRGQTAAEELAVPDSYFDGADRRQPFSAFYRQSVGPRLFVDAILEDRPIRPDFGDGHAVQCVVEAAFQAEQSSVPQIVRAHASD